MVCINRKQRGIDLPAQGGSVWAPRGKTAAGRRGDRVGNIALQYDPIALVSDIRDWNGGQQRLGIGVGWRVKNVRFLTDLHNLSQIHYSDSITDVAYDAQVMGNKQI